MSANKSMLQLHSSISQNIYSYLPRKDAYTLFLANKQLNKAGLYYFQALYYQLRISFNRPDVPNPSAFMRNLLSRKACNINIDSNAITPIDIPNLYNIESILMLSHSIIVALGFNGALYFYTTIKSPLELTEANENMCCKQIAGCNGLIALVSGVVIEYSIIEGALEKKGKVEILAQDEIVGIAATNNLYYAVGKSNCIYAWNDSYNKKIQLSYSVQIAAELTKLYIIDSNLVVRTIDDTKYKETSEITIEENKEMSHLKLTSLHCGSMYTIGMQRKIIPEISKWSTEDLCERLAVGMFEKVNNIIKYSKITGAEIANANEKYVSDTLGITLINEKQKFLNTIEKLKQGTNIVTLHGIGSNKYGQMGNKSYSLMKTPIKIQLPELQECEYVDRVSVCVLSLIIITNKQRAFIMGNIDQEGKALEWVQLTPNTDSGYNNYINIASQRKKEILCIYHIEGKPLSKPFKPADKILQQIKWDTHLNSDEYTIGYEDRFLGMLEVPYAQYANAEIPFHRIYFIKKGSKIVWDRKQKLNFV